VSEPQRVPLASLAAEDRGLASRLLAGDRRALAKAITLIESRRPEHRARAAALLDALLPHSGRAVRLGVSGAPGAGKSTLIETLGLRLCEEGRRVAVLAVDPTSAVTGGSILGDKTRMVGLARHANAYIRPSPSGGTLGGVAEKTREAMTLCEAAGHDVILVETVGVGQSEVTVSGMVDVFALLQLPNAGDELQALKKGIVELADIIVINKTDADPKGAQIAQLAVENVLTLLVRASPHWDPPVLALSSLTGEGVGEFWQAVERYRVAMQRSGEWAEKRRRQAVDWMWNLIESGLRAAFRHHPEVRAELPRLSEAVEHGRMAPSAAAAKLLALVQRDS